MATKAATQELVAADRQKIALFVEPSEKTDSAQGPAGAHTEFEIGHVLFIDLVGYSKLVISEQIERLQELNDIVRSTRQFQRATTEGSLVLLPTGDGMALVFRSSPEAPAQCALEISEALQSRPQLQLRMGIHSGPVNEVHDVNERTNIAGAGINIAQRVMDCGDAGHILLSRHIAEDLEHSARWRPYLHELGRYEVKHGVIISLVNLYNDNLGNPACPGKLIPQKPARVEGRLSWVRSTKSGIIIACSLGILALVAASYELTIRHPTSTPVHSGTRSPNIAAPPKKSIAVLPFQNLSSNQETAFFTDGVQDEILTDLAKVSDLKVTSRTSVMQYANVARRNLQQIAQQLGVAHILEGSVQRAGNRIRVNAQLIDAQTDAHIWAQTYDRDISDVFGIQTEIAKTIADQLQARLSPREAAAIQAKPTGNLVAYELYLRATQIDRDRASAIGSGGAEEAIREVELLNQAISHDPNFVAAICLLAQTHLYLYWINADSPEKHLALGREALAAAARLEPNSGQVHLIRAMSYYWGERDYSSALSELALARPLLPNDIRVLLVTGLIERRQGKWTESTRHLEQALALDPCNVIIISELAGVNYPVLHRYADAMRVLDAALIWKPFDFNLGLIRANVAMNWKADLSYWKSLVAGPSAKSADARDLVTARFQLAIRERNYLQATELAQQPSAEIDDNGFLTPREWNEGIAARGLGQLARAQKAFLAARESVAKDVEKEPNEAKALMVIAQLDAALGNKEKAISEGEQAVKLLPIAKDAVNGYHLLARLTTIYARLGERDRAIRLLQDGLSRPFGPTYGSLKLDEVWDSLRGDPRFSKMIAALAPAK